jgi:LacI family transcriptional regulator
MPRRTIQVGLVLGFSLNYYRDVVRGIKAFAETRPRWNLTPIDPVPEAVEATRTLDYVGLIAHVFDREMADALLGTGKPVVNVSGVLPELPLPRVGVDHDQVGRLAAAHFLDRGFRHFGFVGYESYAFSSGREAGFVAAVAAVGHRVASYHERVATGWESTGLWRRSEEIQRWLTSLPRPVGVFASHDIQGVQLSEACRRAGLQVPDEVALLGVDNDDLMCELARPSLSSVALPTGRVGFEAARLLDRLVTRPTARAPSQPLLFPPLGVVVRQSSDVLAIGDAELTEAVRFVHDHAHEPIRVGDVLGAVPVSRRSLERRFRAALGRGIGEEIRRVHVDRAKNLLARTELPMAQVAVQAGFTEPRHLSVVFRQETGMTPSAYRQRFRVGP